MSPETLPFGGQTSDLREVVDQFYAALAARDGTSLAVVIDENFAEHARLSRPASLPGGGEVEGAPAIKRMMTAIAAAEGGSAGLADLRVGDVVESTEGPLDRVVVELRFSWAGTPTSALEWWVFEDLKVIELRAYYWDTAAMLQGAAA